jgi:hypothetical protein
MLDECVEKYQLAGLDDHGRGFTRIVEVWRTASGYRAIFRYEARKITVEAGTSQEAVLVALVRSLQAEGFSQLRSQLSFRGTTYLGSRQPWIQYPDQRPSLARTRLAQWLARFTGSGRL